MGFFLKKKTSAELCRAKSTWKENLLFFSMTFNCNIIAALLYFWVCVQWRCEVGRKCLVLVQDWREGQKLHLGSCRLMWVGLSIVNFRVFPKELPSLLKSCHLLLPGSAGDQRPALPSMELSLWAFAAGWESWCYSSATLMLTVPSGKQQQPSLCSAGVLLQ